MVPRTHFKNMCISSTNKKRGLGRVFHFNELVYEDKNLTPIFRSVLPKSDITLYSAIPPSVTYSIYNSYAL